MLSRLKVANFLLIEQLELNFYAGLTVVTGETGSGKSIIIDALMLLFGARVPRDIIRVNQKQAIFEAEFSLSNSLTIDWLEDNDLLDLDNPKNVICRRIVDGHGKNKAYINGNAVTGAQIKALGELILDIHIQHASITLLKSETQRNLLDEYAGIEIRNLTAIYKSWNEAKQKLHHALTQTEALSIKQQVLAEILAEFATLNLKPGEWEGLNLQQKQLANAGEVLQELDYAQNILNGQEHAVIKKVSQLSSRLQKIAVYVPKVEELITLLTSAEIELQELNNSLSFIAATVEQDPALLSSVENRINEVFDLSRKYRIAPEQIDEKLSEWQEELDTLTNGYNVEDLRQEVRRLGTEYSILAKQISLIRHKSANELGTKITEYLQELAISGEFRVGLVALSEAGSYGLENVEYQVSFNKGITLQPLAKAASGGELSRTALALYLLLSVHNPPEVIIFDEVDVGIGGKVASIVGKMLFRLGKVKQVICITHQPQTASFGNQHLIVSKHNKQEVTLAEVVYVDGDKRIDEIARMLSGVKITPTTLSHAAEMLLNAGINGENKC